MNAEKTTPDNHALSTVDDCRIIELPRHRHPNGSLTEVDNIDAPFPVRRVFYFYDIPADAERGFHSHYEVQELVMAVSGSFDVSVSDGSETRRFTLNRPYRGLHIPAGLWINLDNFSSGSVGLVLTSELFTEEDYCRDYQVFKQLSANKIKR